MAENDDSPNGLLSWRLPDGEGVFFAHDKSGSFITSAPADRYLRIYGGAWFSVRPREGQWWLYFIEVAQLRDRIRIELPPTQEEAMAWMRMVAGLNKT